MTATDQGTVRIPDFVLDCALVAFRQCNRMNSHIDKHVFYDDCVIHVNVSQYIINNLYEHVLVEASIYSQPFHQ